MCHSAESFLSEGNPTLFYPAIGLTSGLIPSLQEDLEWCFGEHMQSVQWIKRLNSIGERLNKRIFIFIDGWNEITEKALKINHECQRLELNHIAIVLSTTSPSLKRLLIDEAGNPTYVAECVDLTFPQIEKLLSEPLRETERLGIVQIGKFNHHESIKAKEIYARSYKVSFQSSDILLDDPFYLRLASELFSEKEVPKSITRTELIRSSLVQKGKRRNINEMVLYDTLIDLAEVFYQCERPTSILNFPKAFRDEEKLIPWQESAILILLNIDSPPNLDFYYSHDLDFSVAVLYKNWRKTLSTSDESKILKELNESIKTEVGQSALRWFLSNPENCDLIQTLFQTMKFEACFNLPTGKILSEAIVKQVILNNQIEFHWLEYHLDKLIAFEMNENAHVSELPELLFSFIMSLNRETEKDSYRFWMQHLVKHDTSIEEIGLKESYVFRIYSPEEEELRSYDGYGYDLEIPFDTELFDKLLFNEDCEIAKRASLFLAYVCPYHYLELLPTLFNKLYQNRIEIFLDLIEAPCCGIINELQSQYFGQMCPGWLTNTEKGSEEIINEYDLQIKLWSPVLRIIRPKSDLCSFIINTIEVLKDYALIGEDEKTPFKDPNQLKLYF